MAAPELQIIITAAKRIVTVRLVGEAHFDFDASDAYIQKILAHKPETIIIDASKLSFLSSVGMNFLINLKRRLDGGSLRLAALQPAVESSMKNARLLKLFDVHASVAAARKAGAAEGVKS